MAKIYISEFIHRPPQEVFALLAEPARLPLWQSGPERAEWTLLGEPGVGSRFRVVSRFRGNSVEVLMEITHWEPPYRHGFKSIQIPSPIKKIQAITTLTPTESGTQLTMEGEVELSGIFKLADGFVRRQTQKQDAANYAALKRLLEAG